ncbi:MULTISPECIES: hypothetical protein [Staphylococcus]|uniref:hypothetical protein n=1 Tax=Staphylococcus TaxID=1279 RepID=UPI000305D0FE|nr:hypothetical protein [Staphylococcus aureus]EIB2248363.1 hypothetical protein [Staphylococcus aureus]EIB2248654.1 hypothetical protein [Staphylococcus aureus]EKF1806464.1 hypothetical protein [Staphylococcus aureus]EKF1809301.1 hypothetical protein [Staphylococcus aureus]EUQ60645.1 hypothetical protein T791_02662 [Staphylococcus aureus WAMC6003]
MKKIILLFKNPIYSKLFLANFTSQFGGTIGLTAIMFFFLKEFTDMPSLAT